MSQDDEMLEGFIEESREHLESIEDDILTLEQQGESPDEILVNRVFRAMHTIKGNAGFFNLDNLRMLAHSLEDLFSCVRNGDFGLDSELADAVLEGADALKSMLENPQADKESNQDERIRMLKSILDRKLGKEKAEVLEQSHSLQDEGEEQIPIELRGIDLNKIRPGEQLYYVEIDLLRWEKTLSLPLQKCVKNFISLVEVIDVKVPEPKFDFEAELKNVGLLCQVLFATHKSQSDFSSEAGLPETSLRKIDIGNTMPESCDLDWNRKLDKVEELCENISQSDLSALVSIMELLKEVNATDWTDGSLQTLGNRLHSLCEMTIMCEVDFDQGRNQLIGGMKKYLAEARKLRAEKSVAQPQSPVAPVAAVCSKTPDDTFSGDNTDLLEIFADSQKQSLLEFETLAMNLEKGDNKAVESLARMLHTLKGEFGVLGLTSWSALVHSMEDKLPDKLDGAALLAFKDALLLALEKISEKGIPAPNKTQLGKILGADAQESLDKSVLPVKNGQKKQVAPAQKKVVVDDSLRVPVERLDQLIDAIGEAVIAQSMIAADPVIAELNTPITVSGRRILQQKVARIDQVMRQIQELSMSLRMVSLRSTFQKMARLVRDLSRKMDKPIDFVMEGEDTELDKSVVEHIGDPLIHMIRNSVDHGIEDVATRKAAGKSEKGKVTLRAYHKAGSVVIEVEDDGAGINKKKVLDKAHEKGVVQAGESIADDEILNLIFAPGFSTATVVTDVSGRGVGMDVVKKNVENLRGAVDLQSEEEKGSTFSIRLPLTLAIINGMVVSCGGERYILPTLSVIETLQLKNEDVQTVVGKGRVFPLRKDLISLVDLAEVLEINEKKRSDLSGIVLVVEDAAGHHLGLLVDRILDQQQVVIKKIGDGVGDVAGVSGAAIMNDGAVALILDVNGIGFSSREEIKQSGGSHE